MTGPFASFRDYVAALESRGRLLRIGSMDQDRFEATGFAYRLIDERGFHGAPAFLVEKIRTGGRWLDGPVLGNVFPGWLAAALAYGVPDGAPLRFTETEARREEWLRARRQDAWRALADAIPGGEKPKAP